jgi:hypothetical protein
MRCKTEGFNGLCTVMNDCITCEILALEGELIVGEERAYYRLWEL